MFGGTSLDAPEKILKSGASVSLSFEGVDTRFAGGPMTTEGLIVVIAKGG